MTEKNTAERRGVNVTPKQSGGDSASRPTPGPWKVLAGSYVVAADGAEIASVLDGRSGDDTDHEMMHANAHLISVAPELLSASEISVEFIGQVLEFLYEQFHDEEMEDDTPEQLLEAFDSAGYGSSKGELYRIVAQLKRTKRTLDAVIGKATGGGQ